MERLNCIKSQDLLGFWGAGPQGLGGWAKGGIGRALCGGWRTLPLIAAALAVLCGWRLDAGAASNVEVLKAPAAPLLAPLQEPPDLRQAVADGLLPPVAERVPKDPLVVPKNSMIALGRPGGEIGMLVSKTKDVRLLCVYGYARLVGFNEDLDLVPDIVKRLEVEDGRIFTFELREGHKWSDGHPFTTEDFRYYWEDVANNPDLSPTGPPSTLLVGDEKPLVEIIDEVTVRYSWSSPNPFFLPALAGASPLFIYRPAHYLKRFHERYIDPQMLAKVIAKQDVRNWAALHNRMDDMYKFDNPDLPTLEPWVNTTFAPTQRFVAVRNPYFHRVDETGQQLPYINRFVLKVTSSALIPAKTAAGESDLQARSLSFSDYTFLKSAEQRSHYQVRLWRTVRASELALYPNLNANDPVWRKLLRDVRFRRALSLAINRHEINQVIYFGLGLEGNQSVLPGSPLHEPEYRQAWADFDLARANALLDQIGLTEHDDRGIRLLPDGRPLEIIVESAGENLEEVDVLELIHDSWLDAGIKLYTKPSQREVLRNRIFAGETVMSIWFGLENGIPTADMSPAEFVPVRQHSYQWPKWGQYFETSGASGEPVNTPTGQKLMDLYHAWRTAGGRHERRRIWDEILAINAEQVYTIGLVAEVPQPVVVTDRLRNVPKEGIFNWDPGAQFGMYRPDTFWFEPAAKPGAQSSAVQPGTVSGRARAPDPP